MTDASTTGAVERLAPYAVDGGCDAYGQMESDPFGDYVSYEAYQALVAERDAAIKRAEAVSEALNCLDGEPEYHESGMGCGLEDRNITDRYEAMAYGWNQAMERIFAEHINPAIEALSASPAQEGGERHD